MSTDKAIGMPRIIVQRIEVSWSKLSRGGDAATLRNSLAEALVLPESALHSVDRATHHDVRFDEFDDFVATSKVLTADVLHAYSPTTSTRCSVTLEADGDTVVVGFVPSDDAGAPRREAKPRVFLLAPSQWGRVAFNARFAYEGAWLYGKIVFNILHRGVGKPTGRVFLDTQPQAESRHMADLL